MANVTKTVGTASRDYSTAVLWEADLDDTGIYSSGDNAIAEFYADSDFTNSLTVNGGGTVGLASITLRPATGQRHNGTAGTGVRLLGNVQYTLQTTMPCTVDGLEFNGNGARRDRAISMNGFGNADMYTQRCLVWNYGSSQGWADGIYNSCYNGKTGYIHNNIVYGLKKQFSGTTRGFGVYMGAASNVLSGVHNNTVYNVTDSRSQTGWGIQINTANSDSVKNNICASCRIDFLDTNGGTDYNCSSDTTATGTNSLTSQSASSLFTSLTAGSENLHLKAGAAAIDAGTNVGSSPTGVNVDIDGRDRVAQGDTWDMGADEYVAASSEEFIPIIMYF